jgi:hypothetical protein
MGAGLYFSTIEDSKLRFTEGGKNPERAIQTLYLSCIMLAYVEADIVEIEQRFKKLHELAVFVKNLPDPEGGLTE